MTDDIIVRALPPTGETTDGKTIFGRIARANEWAEIDSVSEGHFLERNAPGAFAKTFTDGAARIHILFQHGQDPEVGDKPIAVPLELGEDSVGAFYRGELFDGIPPLVRDGLKAGVYGSSHRFRVVRDDWERNPKRSDYNPSALPERTIREAKVFELGPVTWPAFDGSSAAVRSLTDQFLPAPVPVAPSDDAEPQVLTSPERRDEPVAPIVETPSRSIPVEYVTREDKAARLSELKEIIARVASEHTGVMPDPVQAAWEADNREYDALVADLAALDVRDARLRQLQGPEHQDPSYSPPTIIRTKSEADIYDIESITRGSRSYDERDQKLRDSAMRSIEKSAPAHPRASTDGFRSGLARYLDNNDSEDKEAARRILLTGSPVYRRAFNKYLRGEVLTPEESRAAALAVTGTTTTGGYAVPYVFDPTFINIGAHTSVNPYRAACRVETITGGNNWRAVTSTAVTAAWNTEAAAETEQGPTIGQPTFTVQRASAFATVSIETLQDRPDIGNELGVLFQEAKDTLEENSFTLGVGTTVYPQGMFLSGAFTVVSTATNDVTAISDTQLVEAALPLRHRMGAAWFMSRSTQRQLEVLDTGGYYFKRAGQQYALESTVLSNQPSGNTGTQLLGYPIWETPSAVSTLTTDAAVIAVLCDPRNYVIVDRLGLNVEVIPHMLNGATPSFPTGQRGIFAMWRSTARVLNVDGGRQLDVN